MEKFSLMQLKTSEGWKKKSRPSTDGRIFEYYVHPYLSDEDIGIPNTEMNFVRVDSGMWVPRHYHEQKDEHFVCLEGMAILYIRENEEADEEEVALWPGDLFRVEPGEVHGVRNFYKRTFYLSRFALHSFPGDSVYIE